MFKEINLGKPSKTQIGWGIGIGKISRRSNRCAGAGFLGPLKADLTLVFPESPKTLLLGVPYNLDLVSGVIPFPFIHIPLIFPIVEV